MQPNIDDALVDGSMRLKAVENQLYKLAEPVSFGTSARRARPRRYVRSEGDERNVATATTTVGSARVAYGLCVAARGLFEYRATPATQARIWLTLMRAVGEMGDWGKFEVPSAQMRGAFALEYALIPFGNGDIEVASNEIAAAPVLPSARTLAVTQLHATTLMSRGTTRLDALAMAARFTTPLVAVPAKQVRVVY
jgi:hypothetical protein